LDTHADRLRTEGATAICNGGRRPPARVFDVADPVQDSTPAAMANLRKQGLHIVMLTGHNRVTADAVGHRLSLDRVEAEVLPGHKSDVVRRLESEGRVVAMAGDRVNDAPALAAATSA